MQFADIHTHILPGVDDGANSIGESVQMLRIAYDSGTRAMVASPHMFLDIFANNDPAAISPVFESLQKSLAELAAKPEYAFLGEMQVLLGAENYACLEFIQALERGQVLPINGGAYLLVEFSPFVPFASMISILDRILKAGFIPVVAHTERIIAVQEKPKRIAPAVQAGCVVQVNADGLADSAARSTRKAAMALLGDGLGHVVASDGHRPGYRPPVLGETCRKLLGRYSKEQVQAWLWENPARIIANQPILRA